MASRLAAIALGLLFVLVTALPGQAATPTEQARLIDLVNQARAARRIAASLAGEPSGSASHPGVPTAGTGPAANATAPDTCRSSHASVPDATGSWSATQALLRRAVKPLSPITHR